MSWFRISSSVQNVVLIKEKERNTFFLKSMRSWVWERKSRPIAFFSTTGNFRLNSISSFSPKLNKNSHSTGWCTALSRLRKDFASERATFYGINAKTKNRREEKIATIINCQIWIEFLLLLYLIIIKSSHCDLGE